MSCCIVLVSRYILHFSLRCFCFTHITRKPTSNVCQTSVVQHERPTINKDWSDPIKEALNSSFDSDFTKRPSIQLFYNVLRFQLLGLGRDDAKLQKPYIERRRSVTSLRGLGYDKDGDDKQLGGHAKSPQAQSSSNGNEDQSQVQPRRRTRNKLRDKFDKFRMSVKREES